MRKANPYPLPDGTYNFSAVTKRSELVEYAANRMMAQDFEYESITNRLGEYFGTAVVSQTQRDLSLLQTPNDNMRLSGNM